METICKIFEICGILLIFGLFMAGAEGGGCRTYPKPPLPYAEPVAKKEEATNSLDVFSIIFLLSGIIGIVLLIKEYF